MNLTSEIARDVTLRALEPSDLDLLYRWENDTSLWREGETFQPWSRELLRQYASGVQDIYTNKQLRLVITTSDGSPIGLLDFFDFDARNRKSGIGILIADSKDRQKGLGYQTLVIAKEYAFNILLLDQLYCDVLASNQASKRLFEKAGFIHNGTRRNWVTLSEGKQDVHFYQCLKSE